MKTGASTYKREADQEEGEKRNWFLTEGIIGMNSVPT
jgi:hypothetical protein